MKYTPPKTVGAIRAAKRGSCLNGSDYAGASLFAVPLSMTARAERYVARKIRQAHRSRWLVTKVFGRLFFCAEPPAAWRHSLQSFAPRAS
jgi:hypothetical protein